MVHFVLCRRALQRYIFINRSAHPTFNPTEQPSPAPTLFPSVSEISETISEFRSRHNSPRRDQHCIQLKDQRTIPAWNPQNSLRDIPHPSDILYWMSEARTDRISVSKPVWRTNGGAKHPAHRFPNGLAINGQRIGNNTCMVRHLHA